MRRVVIPVDLRYRRFYIFGIYLYVPAYASQGVSQPCSNGSSLGMSCAQRDLAPTWPCRGDFSFDFPLCIHGAVLNQRPQQLSTGDLTIQHITVADPASIMQSCSRLYRFLLSYKLLKVGPPQHPRKGP